MKSDKYREVSIIGRIAYGMMCVEAYLINKYPQKKWDLLVEKLWKITKMELWDDWMDEVIEIIPEYLFEFQNYESAEFEYLSKEQYIELKYLFDGIGADVNQIVKLYYELANSHAYSSIVEYGEESLIMLDKIIQFLMENNVNLPTDLEIMKHKFSENNGWGNTFIGQKYSTILTCDMLEN